MRCEVCGNEMKVLMVLDGIGLMGDCVVWVCENCRRVVEVEES